MLTAVRREFMKHIFENEYSDREKYTTCLHCGQPLANNQMVKDSYQLSTQFGWMKSNIRIIADMIKDKGDDYISGKLYEIIERADKRLKF